MAQAPSTTALATELRFATDPLVPPGAGGVSDSGPRTTCECGVTGILCWGDAGTEQMSEWDGETHEAATG